MIAAEVGAIPNLLTTNKDTTHHAVGSIYQLMAIEYVAVLILHAGLTVVARELLWVQQKHVRSAANSQATNIR